MNFPSDVQKYSNDKQVYKTTSDDEIGPSVAQRRVQASVSEPVSPERMLTGPPTPPPLDKKKPRPVSLQYNTVQQNEYDYKLKVFDTKGRKLPRIVFRWCALFIYQNCVR